MSALRVLLIDAEAREAERISAILGEANHTVLPATGWEEASEALFVEKFDAVLLGSPLPADGLAQFTAKLRELENRQRESTRIPILSLSKDLVDASRLTEAVTSLARAIRSSGDPLVGDGLDLPAFEPEKFQAQVGYDPDLLVEVIDLFLAESVDQMREMHEALAAGEYDRLSRAAHTIKGSLSSLHTTAARHHAQELESAAKDGNEQLCRESLSALEDDLDAVGTTTALVAGQFPPSLKQLLHLRVPFRRNTLYELVNTVGTGLRSQPGLR